MSTQEIPETIPSHDDRITPMIVFAVEYLSLEIEPAKAAGQSLPALGIDSLEFMSLVAALEEAFGVELDLDRLENTPKEGADPRSLAETLELLIVERS